MVPFHISVRINDRSAARIFIPANGHVILTRDDDWKEGEHPRGKGGQFTSGGSAHVVASHHPETGNIVIHAVKSDRQEATKHQIGVLQKQHEKFDRDYGAAEYGHSEHYESAVRTQQMLSQRSQPFAQNKAITIQGGGDPNKGFHVVAEGNHGGGLTVHGAYTDEHEARAHAERLSKEAWATKGETRSDISDREVSVARREFNRDRPSHEQVSAEQASNGGHEAFDAFLDAKHPMDEVLPHPGRTKANRHFVENHLAFGPGMHEGRTGVIRVMHHKPQGD